MTGQWMGETSVENVTKVEKDKIEGWTDVVVQGLKSIWRWREWGWGQW